MLERLRSVPRHLFVDEALASRAYENTALPIGFGQTISQPYIVALMTQALVRHLRPGARLDKVLEIGTGCGYQTAVLAPFAGHIYSVERIGPLLRRARARLSRLKIRNVTLRHGDGWRGWKTQAPFQGIVVAASPPEVQPELLDQLDEGGRLVIPIGRRGGAAAAVHHPARGRPGHRGTGSRQLRATRHGDRGLRIFSGLYDRALSWAGHPHAQRYLVALSFAESSFFPVPPDVLLAPDDAGQAGQGLVAGDADHRVLGARRAAGLCHRLAGAGRG